MDEITLKNKMGVRSWTEITTKDGVKIVEQVQTGYISKEEWDYLGKVVPRFMDVVSAGLTTIGSLATGIASTQSEALNILNEGVKAAKKIAESSDDPTVKARAFETIDKAFAKAEKMNKTNSKSWIAVLKTAALVVFGAGAAVAYGRSSR